MFDVEFKRKRAHEAALILRDAVQQICEQLLEGTVPGMTLKAVREMMKILEGRVRAFNDSRKEGKK